jgi:tetratricopeptide (TPR) repeat protein
MPQSTRFRAVTACLLAAASVSAAGFAQPARAATDADAVVAEMALQKGQCREAAEAFLKAASASQDVALAARATQVALGCEQLDTAQHAAARWQQLAPGRGEPAFARALVAMKRYQPDEARKALALWRDSGAAGNQDPGRFAQLLENETEATIAFRVFGDVLLGEDPTAEVVLAQATLALHAYDLRKAVQLAERALGLQGRFVPAQVVRVRARAMRGETDAALDEARSLADKLSGEDVYLVADVLALAQRSEGAREELLRLRADAQLAAGADRRLGSLALEQGDLPEAEKRFAGIVGQRGQATVALLSLARIFERRGDDERALRTYALLGGSTVSLAARAGAARLLLKQGKRDAALALFDGYLKEHPESAIEVAGARAQLFAVQGEVATAVAVLDAALKDYPGHPQLQYQRATMLERAGRSADAERAFEQLLKQRPEDPGVANALGFTLADHNRSLDRAEKLVRQALAVSPDNPSILDSLGWVRFRRGHVDEAVQSLELAWRGTRDAEIGAHFGEVLWKHREEGRARYVWQQALNVDPDDVLLRKTIQRLTGEAPPRDR